jgi:hypothetical protein
MIFESKVAVYVFLISVEPFLFCRSLLTSFWFGHGHVTGIGYGAQPPQPAPRRYVTASFLTLNFDFNTTTIFAGVAEHGTNVLNILHTNLVFAALLNPETGPE